MRGARLPVRSPSPHPPWCPSAWRLTCPSVPAGLTASLQRLTCPRQLPFGSGQRPGIRPVMRDSQRRGWTLVPVSRRLTAHQRSLPGQPVPARDLGLCCLRLTGGAWRRPRTLTGFSRSACASCDRGGRPLDPGASGVHTAGEICPAAACRSSTARPCTPVFVPSPGALGNEASAGVHSRSPVRSSPRLRPRMERDALRLLP